MTVAPTIVVFRRFKATGQVIALFPYVRKGYGLCNSFTCAGGHAVAELAQVLRETTAASALTQQDVRAMLQDLAGMPYRYSVKVVTAEEITIEREGLGEQMSLFVLPATVVPAGPRQPLRLTTQALAGYQPSLASA